MNQAPTNNKSAGLMNQAPTNNKSAGLMNQAPTNNNRFDESSPYNLFFMIGLYL